MSTRLKRIIAFVLDWNITLFPFMFVFILLLTFVQQQSSASLLYFAIHQIISVFRSVFILILRFPHDSKIKHIRKNLPSYVLICSLPKIHSAIISIRCRVMQLVLSSFITVKVYHNFQVITRFLC